MLYFKNIFINGFYKQTTNFEHIVNIRRSKMINDGLNVNNINWELYSKILEAKNKKLKML